MRPQLPSGLAAALLLAIVLPPAAAAQSPQERLWEASIAGDTAALRQAAAEGADVNSLDTRRSRNGRRALNWAALNDRVPALEVLLQLGADLEGENLTGFTALHHAAEAGSLAAAEFLLAAGADPVHINTAGRTPRQTADAQGFGAVSALLARAEQGDLPPKRQP
ncbi:MAG TPA: ankyrin repeat domain-containing protein [Gemmatimonadales bacterium]|nr:ankyrin repeat domain-containing protein [Gemmatimonadales bacterium]